MKFFKSIDNFFRHKELHGKPFTFILFTTDKDSADLSDGYNNGISSEILRFLYGMNKHDIFKPSSSHERFEYILNLDPIKIKFIKKYEPWISFRKYLSNELKNTNELVSKNIISVLRPINLIAIESTMNTFVFDLISLLLEKKSCFSTLLSLNGESRSSEQIESLFYGKDSFINFVFDVSLSTFCNLEIYKAVYKSNRTLQECGKILVKTGCSTENDSQKYEIFYSKDVEDFKTRYIYGKFEIIIVKSATSRTEKLFLRILNSSNIIAEKLEDSETCECKCQKENSAKKPQMQIVKFKDIENITKDYKKKSKVDGDGLDILLKSVIGDLMEIILKRESKTKEEEYLKETSGIKISISTTPVENTSEETLSSILLQKNIMFYVYFANKPKELKGKINLICKTERCSAVVDFLQTISSYPNTNDLFMLEVFKSNLKKIIEFPCLLNCIEYELFNFERFLTCEYLEPHKFVLHKWKVPFSDKDMIFNNFKKAFDLIKTANFLNFGIKIESMEYETKANKEVDVDIDVNDTKTIKRILEENFVYYYSSNFNLYGIKSNEKSYKYRMIKITLADKINKEEIYVIFDHKRLFQRFLMEDIERHFLENRLNIISFITEDFENENHEFLSVMKDLKFKNVELIDILEYFFRIAKKLMIKCTYDEAVKIFIDNNVYGIYKNHHNLKIDDEDLVLKMKDSIHRFQEIIGEILYSVPRYINKKLMGLDKVLHQEILIFTENNYTSKVFDIIQKSFYVS